MTQLQNNNSQNTHFSPNDHSNYPTNGNQTLQYPPSVQFQNQDQSDSDNQQNKAIVEAIFSNKNQINSPIITQENQDHEDEDIKRFLQEQIPGIYNQKETQEFSYKQEQENCSYYNNSIAPQYFTMSRFQKQKYFQNLNAVYLARLNSSRPRQNAHNLKQNGQKGGQNQIQNYDNKNSNKKIKRAIKFNQIIFEVPFNKQQEPIVIKDTPQEQGYIVFDDQAYQGQYVDEQNSQQSDEQQADYLNSKSNYFDDFDLYDFEQNFKTKILSNVTDNRLEFFSSIQEQAQQNSDQEYQSEQSNQNQEQVIKNSSSSTISSSDQDDALNKYNQKYRLSLKNYRQNINYDDGEVKSHNETLSSYKRGFDRKFISSSSSQEEQQSDQSQDNGYLFSGSDDYSQDEEQEQEEYKKFMKGRKIAPVCFNKQTMSEKNKIQQEIVNPISDEKSHVSDGIIRQ